MSGSTLSRRVSEFVGVALFALALIWLVAQVPGLRDNANGSIIEADGKPGGEGDDADLGNWQN